MSEYFDALDTRSNGEREDILFDRLRTLLRRAKDHSDYYGEVLADIDPASITDRASLAQLPLLRKSALHALQAGSKPYGGVNIAGMADLSHLFLSPGPIAEPEARQRDYYRAARAMHAAGFRAGDIVQNVFSYHMTPAGLMFDSGAQELSCAVIPAGPGNTAGQVEVAAHYGSTAYVGTPDFLKLILEKADELGVALPTLKRGLVTAGPFFPALKDFYAARNIDMFECFGTAELGIVAYQSEAKEGLLINEDVIAEVVRPGTGDPVADGEVGELVITIINEAYPLIRFATGDMTAMMTGTSPCGRTAPRMKGWMGRADQTTKVRGMFVHPEQVAKLVDSFEAVSKARLTVTLDDGLDKAGLTVEASQTDDALAAALADAAKEILKVRADITLVAPGELPNDGLVIEDKRA